MASSDKNKKKKKWIAPVAVMAAVAVAAAFVVPRFLISGTSQAATSSLFATAERGDISSTVTGSGTLSSGDALSLDIPAALSVQSVQVEEGDYVEEGDVLATLDSTALQSAILETQSNIDALDGQIESAKDDDDQQEIASSVSGRVKQIYAAEGDDIAAAMQNSGSLMVLSLDGTMTFSFEGSGFSVGDEVNVTLSDGETVKTGRVVSAANGIVQATVSDNGPQAGEKVTVSSDGETIGTGVLSITTELQIYGGKGTVLSVDVEENEAVSAGDVLFTLSQGSSTEYESLLNKRQQYADVLKTLLGYAQTDTITATSSGTISSISVEASGSTDSSSQSGSGGGGIAPVSYSSSSDDDVLAVSTLSLSGGSSSAEQLSAGKDTETVLLAEDGDAAAVTDISGTLGIYINNPVTNNTPQSTIMPGTGFSGSIIWNPNINRFDEGTVYSANVTLTAAAGYRFAADALPSVTGGTVSDIAISDDMEGNRLSFTVTFAATEFSSSMGSSDQSQSQNNFSNTTGQQYSSNSSATVSGGSYSSGGTSSASQSSSSSSSSDDDSESLWQSGFGLLSGQATTLVVNADELDISTIEAGQDVAVSVDAFPDETFTGTVTKISGSGTSQSGVTTYPVTVTLTDGARDNLMDGMNATATITTAVSEDVLMIPVAALQQMGSKQFVYVTDAGSATVQSRDDMQDTASADGEELMGELREVTTGVSNSTYVEITSGLSEGETVIYTQAEDDAETGGFVMMMGGMGGNAMEFSMDTEGARPAGGMSGGMGGGPMS